MNQHEPVEIGTRLPCVGGPLDGQSREYEGGIGLIIPVRVRAPKLSGPDEPIDYGEWERHYYDLEKTPEGSYVYLHKESEA